MEIEALRVIVKVAQLGSYTQAATQLGVSRSRVSQVVQDLEAELGATLFQRTTRVVRPTADGEQLVARARGLVAEADEIAALFEGPRNLKGRVRVDLPTIYARTTVIPRIPELLALHPLLELEISTTDRMVDLRREGVDIAMRVGAIADDTLTALKLGAMAMVNVVSATYAQTYGLPRTLEELDQHLIVHYSATFGDPPTFEYGVAGDIVAVPMKSLIAVNNIEAYRAACIAGLGIVQVPRWGVRELINNGTFIEVLPDHAYPSMPTALVHAHGRQVPKRVRAVMSWLVSLIEPVLS